MTTLAESFAGFDWTFDPDGPQFAIRNPARPGGFVAVDAAPGPDGLFAVYAVRGDDPDSWATVAERHLPAGSGFPFPDPSAVGETVRAFAARLGIA